MTSGYNAYERELASAKAWLKGETVCRPASHYFKDRPVKKRVGASLDADQFWSIYSAALECSILREGRPAWDLNPIGDVILLHSTVEKDK